MKRRRDKFFAEAIRNIGKNHEKLIKEVKDKVLEKRTIKIEGFEITKIAKKQLLMRSGSLEHKPRDENDNKD